MHEVGRRVAMLAGAALAPTMTAPAVAQDRSCEHVLTSTLEGACSVQFYSICANGERRVESFFEGNLTSAPLVTDADLGLISAPALHGGQGVARVVATVRAFSMDELLETGRSAGAYKVAEHGSPVTGFAWDARLTGQQATTSGVTFQVARLGWTLEDASGGSAGSGEGAVLIDPERRLLVFGPPSTGGDQPAVDVILPGEPGFEGTVPGDCAPRGG